MAQGLTRLINLVLLSNMLHSDADEMAWGDIMEDGSLNMRSLDVPIASARGTENFFIADPMAAHDWARVTVVERSLNAQYKLASSAKADSSINSIEKMLKPIFAVMPKNEEGLLSNGTARYALHRLFTEQKSWDIKGLQPAGGSWIKSMSVTSDVREVSKYMVPSYLQDLILRKTGTNGMDLRSLAVMAATLEHLIHAELLSILYSVYATLNLPTAGKRSDRETDDILDMFMMVYAFGLNLEISTYRDMAKAKHHLENQHAGWPHVRAFVQGQKRKFSTQRALRGSELGFPEILQVVEEIGQQYPRWHHRDCTRAEDHLSALRGFKDGRVAISEVAAVHTAGYRSLFTESQDELHKLGVLAEPGPQLIASNYINSQIFCLSTASYYTACCPNKCDGPLGAFERGAAASSGEPGLIMKLADSLNTSPAGNASDRQRELEEIAANSSGVVPLHGRPFAEWMHRAFPMQCPAPNDMPTTNPKTPDEWMGEPSENIKDTEDMMAEFAVVLQKYTAMGKKMEDVDAPADDVQSGSDVITQHAFKGVPKQAEPLQRFSRLLPMVVLLSLIGLIAKVTLFDPIRR